MFERDIKAFNPFHNMGSYSVPYYEYCKDDIVLTYRNVDIVECPYINGFNFIYKGTVIKQRHGYKNTYKQVIDDYLKNPRFIIVD